LACIIVTHKGKPYCIIDASLRTTRYKPAIVQQNTDIICKLGRGSVCPAEQRCALYLYNISVWSSVCSMYKIFVRLLLLLTTEVYDMFIYHIVNCGGPMIIDAGFFLLGIPCPSCSGYLAISAKS
jgi:hypothetical protein